MSSLSSDQLDDLQGFLKDWLRHAGRSQADLRRALRAPSIRMPVLIEELRLIHARGGLLGLAETLCDIDVLWQGEERGLLDGESRLDPVDCSDSFGQLDLLLEEIRQGG
ncbi:MAG: hypothetical protein ACKO0M_13885 [Cyanobium sp.]